MGNQLTTGFLCGICGQRHEVLPLSFSVKAPLAVTKISSEQVEGRVVITPDQCAIDNTIFYLRGRFLLPVRDLEQPFIWGIWAEVSPKNFMRTNELWKTEGRESEPAFRGYLDSQLPLYGSTLNLEVSVATQKVGWRPHFTVLNADHPLAREQREGISLERVEAIAAWVFHTQVQEP